MGVYTRSDSPYFYIYLETTGKKEPTEWRRDGTTPELRKAAEKNALNLYHRRMIETASGQAASEPEPPSTRTLSEQIAWYKEHVLPTRKNPGFEEDVLPRLDADLGHVPLVDFRQRHAVEWRTKRLAQPHQIAGKKQVKARAVTISASGIERQIDVLKAVLKSAVPDHLPASPLYGMGRLKGLTPKRAILKERDEAKLMAVLDDDDAALVALGMDALVRLNDLLDIKQTDDDGKRIWVANPKGGEGFWVPVSKRARKLLDKLKGRGDGYYFPRRRICDKATEKERRDGVRQMLRRACERAGVTYGRSKGGITFHWATRRTGLTRMLQRKVPLATAQKVGRWKDERVVLQVYYELEDKDARDAVNAIAPAKKRASHSRSVPGHKKSAKRLRKKR